MNKNKKILSLFIAIMAIFLFGITKAEAATGTIKISANKSQIVVGNSVTFTVTVSSNTGMVALQYNISYDSSQLSLTSGSAAGAPVFNSSTKSVSYKFTFKAKKAGTANFKFSANGATWSGDSEVTFSTASKSVKIITQQQLEDSYSKNNNLSSLGVDGATLSPNFSSSVTSYTVNLPPNTETINVTGKKADSAASVSGLGSHNVDDGINTIKVVVTAENGASKTYTITAIVEELDPIIVKVNEEEYSVVRKEKLLTPPSSDFTYGTTKINEQEVPTLFNEKAQIVLIGLKDSDGNILLYLYDEQTNTYKKYNQHLFKSLTLYIEDKKVDNSDNIKKISIDEEEINGYTNKDDNYYYFYAINLETGKENLYRYDEEEKTVQKYIVPKENIKEDNNSKNNDDLKLYQYIVLGLIGFIFLTYLIILINLLRKNKKKKNDKNKVTVNQENLKQNNSKDDKKSNNKDNKITDKEKNKLIKESEDELNRINTETTNNTANANNTINETLITTDNKKVKKKTKEEKKHEKEIEKKEKNTDKDN